MGQRMSKVTSSLWGAVLVLVVNAISKVFHDPKTLEEARLTDSAFTRSRKLPFATVCYALLNNDHRETNNRMSNIWQKIVSMLPKEEQDKLEQAELEGDKNAIEPSEQAFSKARYKMDWSPFRKAFEAIRGVVYAMGEDGKLPAHLKTQKGFILAAIDGTQTPLPNRPFLAGIFGTAGRGNTSPTARASITYDALNHLVLAAEIVPMKVGERVLAIKHVEELFKTIKPSKLLFLMDRGYPSFNVFKTIIEGGGFFLARVKNGFNNEIDDFCLQANVAVADKTIYLKNPQNPEERLKVRIIKLVLPSGEVETLITNLFFWALCDFKDLYFKRWAIEVNNDTLKNKIELCNFRGWLEIAIYQEFWACIIMNFVSGIIYNISTEEIQDDREGKENSHQYQARLTTIIYEVGQVLADVVFFPKFNSLDREFAHLIRLCKRRIIQVSKGESNTRNSRQSNFHANRKTCSQ